MSKYFLWCHTCGNDCLVPDHVPLTNLSGKCRIFCNYECRLLHDPKEGAPTYRDLTDPIIHDRIDNNTTAQLILPHQPKTTHHIPPSPETIQWPTPEIPRGGSGYGYPNVNWLHYIPDSEVYSFLIDFFRLRMQDIISRPITRLDLFYRQWNKHMAGFKHCLDLAEMTPGLLPIRWRFKRSKCEAICKVDAYYDLTKLHVLGKRSIIRRHNNDRGCILKLRQLGQAVFGYSPGNLPLENL
ncbi:hypothetical protein ACHAPT_004671 [Fusarium lateritium]